MALSPCVAQDGGQLAGRPPCSQPAARQVREGECAWDLQGGTGLNTCAPKVQLKSACFGVSHTEFLKGAERPGKTGANQSLRGYRSNMCFSKGGGEGLFRGNEE